VVRADPPSGWRSRLAAAVVIALVVGGVAATYPMPSDAGSALRATDCLVPQEDPGEITANEEQGRVTVAQVLGKRGEQIGRRVDVQTTDGQAVALNLPPDSFVSQPVGGRLVYARRLADAGSEIRAVSLLNGCDTRLLGTQDVVRSILQSPVDGSLYLHTVVGEERHDGGVTKIASEADADEQVLEPLPSGHGLGAIFSTRLAWADEARTLVVQSCGFEACLTRVRGLDDGTLSTYATEHGDLVGLTPHEIIAFAADHGRPVALLAIDRATGIARVLADEVFDARLTDSDPSTIQVETATGWQEVAP
jgi:hypothetical protein